MSGIEIEIVVMEILKARQEKDQLVTIYSSDNEPVKGYVAGIYQYGDTFTRVPVVQIDQVVAQPGGQGFGKSEKMGWIIISKITKILEE